MKNDLNRTSFPANTAVQGMCANADRWLLFQIEHNDMTEYEALLVAQSMLRMVISLVGRDQEDEI